MLAASPKVTPPTRPSPFSHERGVTRALAAASGDIVAGDPPPGERGWRVQVEALDVPGAPPPQTLLLAHQGVSTSGDAYQFVEIAGTRYSHIIDPRTGIGLTGRSMVTVVAPSGIVADGWDTPLEIIGPERGIRLVEALPGAAVRIVRQQGDAVEVFESSAWKKLPARGAMRTTLDLLPSAQTTIRARTFSSSLCLNSPT